MTPKEKKTSQAEKKQACDFASSQRGQYIIGKALAIAVEKLSAVEGVHKETSDISDMEYLIKNLFEMGAFCYHIENGKGAKS